ncbi:hypothetical protein ACFPRL_03090 [Pseudoclavibacter helvolus]
MLAACARDVTEERLTDFRKRASRRGADAQPCERLGVARCGVRCNSVHAEAIFGVDPTEQLLGDPAERAELLGRERVDDELPDLGDVARRRVLEE